jgi:hypothetical protein
VRQNNNLDVSGFLVSPVFGNEVKLVDCKVLHSVWGRPLLSSISQTITKFATDKHSSLSCFFVSEADKKGFVENLTLGFLRSEDGRSNKQLTRFNFLKPRRKKLF